VEWSINGNWPNYIIGCSIKSGNPIENLILFRKIVVCGSMGVTTPPASAPPQKQEENK